MSRLAFWILMVCAAGAAGCGNADGASDASTSAGTLCISGVAKLDCQPKMELHNATAGGQIGGQIVTSGSVIQVDAGNIALGLADDITFVIANARAVATAADLEIASIRLDYDIASPAEADVRAFECYDDHGHTCDDPAVAWHKVVPPGLEDAATNRAAQEVFHVRYTRFDGKDRVAKLHIKTNDPENGDFVVLFQTKQGKPKVVISPSGLDFPYVAAGQASTRPFKVSNVGDALLIVKSLEFNADSVFSLTEWNGKKHLPGESVVFDPAIELDNGKSIAFDVTFTPTDTAKKQGTILVMSNDPAAPYGAPVALIAGP